jgi:threonylcarbamoyladenosine tRNA methylthiotransferase MtaB
MRIYLDQIGCRLNYSEMETLARRLRAAGHATVATPGEAQVIVFNTCAVTADAARTSRKGIRHLHAANPAARIAVTGCWATLEPAQAAQQPGVALVAANPQKDLLHTLLEPWSAEFDEPASLARLEPDSTPFEASLTPTAAAKARTRVFLKVQDGCNNRCTFCIVTVARGESRSRPLGELVSEVQALVDQGVQEAVLTGVHLGSYGRDLEGDRRTHLKALVAALLRETDIPRLRLSSLEPWELSEGFFDLWAQWPGRLCPHLHLPLQAGTDYLLRRMARRCTTASFRQLVEEARAAIPDLLVTTDLIAGFPGESEAEFAQGLAFVEAMRFADAHIFPFSARAGTAAASFPDAVPTALKKERVHRLHEVVERTGHAERSRFLGTVRPVLWEGEGQPLTDQPGRLWSGFTDNYLRVMAVAAPELELHGQITPVRLDEIQGATMLGTIESALGARTPSA